jgi:hypothetical protein
MLHRQYEGLVGTPKWAQFVTDSKTKKSEDAVDALSRVIFFFFFFTNLF